MDNIGYAVEEVLYLTDLKGEIEGLPKWKRVSRITVLSIVTVCFLVFLGYQVMLTVRSYDNPVWSSSQENRQATAFPGILVCAGRAGKQVNLTETSCRYDNGTVTNGTDIFTTCIGSVTTVNVPVIGVNNPGRKKCFIYNINNTAYAYSVNAFYEIDFLTDRSEDPIYIQYFGAEVTIPTSLKPDMIMVGGTVNYIILERTEYKYLHNSTLSVIYDGTISSTPKMPFTLTIVISFSSTMVTVWQQVVIYDAITVIGILAGCIGFSKSIYSIIFMIVDKIHSKCTSTPTEQETKEVLIEKASHLTNHVQNSISRQSSRNSSRKNLITPYDE